MENTPTRSEDLRIVKVVVPNEPTEPQTQDQENEDRVINVHLDACVCG